MRKILVCSNATFRRNGQTGVVMNLYRHLDRSRFKCDFVTRFVCDPAYKEEIESNGDKIYVLDRSSRNIINYIRQVREIASNGYDIVHIHGSSSTLLLELLAASSIKKKITHSHSSSSNSRILHYLLRPFVNSITNFRLACGEKAGKWMYGSKGFTVINNGVDTNVFKYRTDWRSEIRAKHNLADKTIYGHIGNFAEVKNQTFVVDVFKEILNKQSDAILLLVGEGPLKKDVEKKVETLGLSDNVIFTGAISNVNEYLSAIDVILMPSLFEGFPLSLVEEQASGLPCLVSDVITDLCNITGMVHYISLSESPEKWAEKAFLLSKTTDRVNLSKNNIELIKEYGYSVEVTAGILMNIYESLINR